MTWRTVQLKDGTCDQDKIILNIFGQRPVNFVGPDEEFKAMLTIDANSNCLVLIINHHVWFSDIVKLCAEHITNNINEVYIGINRYYLLGNDTKNSISSESSAGADILSAVKQYAIPQDFNLVNQGTYDNDLGTAFNFVQPLTWIHCQRASQ
jgi:hypothetical protein